jgi:hypothetical protein
VEKNTPFWLCHTTEKINAKDTVVSCCYIMRYHLEQEFLATTSSATECSVSSDLTE